jgi:hypothetical protein
MTEPKWTPGPWDFEWVSAKASGGGHLYIIDSAGRKIAAIWGKAEEKEFAARLIAAAPELAAVADEAPILSKYHGTHGFDVEGFIADYEAWNVTRRAALAKARGEP